MACRSRLSPIHHESNHAREKPMAAEQQPFHGTTTRLQCQAIIFDLDGVLIDSSAVVRRQWRRWATEHGINADAALNVMHGRRLVEIISHVAPHLNAKQEAARLAAREAADTDGLHKIAGAAQLIGSLPTGTWAVVTSGNRDTAMARLKHGNLPVPAVLVTADDVRRGKPDPEAHLLAAERLGIPPSRCVVVEDAPAGVEAARAAGMCAVAVATTHTPRELEEAHVIAASLLDIQIEASHAASNPATGPPYTLLNLIIR